jgi:hypothetical protein
VVVFADGDAPAAGLARLDADPVALDDAPAAVLALLAAEPAAPAASD